MELSILYEDDDLWIVDKYAGLLVCPSKEHEEQETLLSLLTTRGDAAHLVHRLDKDTSGVLVVAKNQHTRELLQKQFKQRTVKKHYLALLDGDIATDYVLQETYLARDKSKRLQRRSYTKHDQLRNCRFARSEFFVLQRFQQRLSLVKITISTGRTHQIRVHAKELAAPVLGDRLYHRPTCLPLSFPLLIREKVLALERQMLHSHLLEFFHPHKQRTVSYSSSPPQDFNELLTLLRTNCPETSS